MRWARATYEDIPSNENKYAYISALQSNGQTDQALNTMNEMLKKFLNEFNSQSWAKIILLNKSKKIKTVLI